MIKDAQTITDCLPSYSFALIMISIRSIRGKPSRLRSKATPTFWCSSLPHGVGTASSGFVALLKHSQFSPLRNANSTALLGQVWRQWEVWCGDSPLSCGGLRQNMLLLPNSWSRQTNPFAWRRRGHCVRTRDRLFFDWPSGHLRSVDKLHWLRHSFQFISSHFHIIYSEPSKGHSNLGLSWNKWQHDTRERVLTCPDCRTLMQLSSGLSLFCNVLICLAFRGGCHCWTQIGRGVRCQRSGVLRSNHVPIMFTMFNSLFQLDVGSLPFAWWLHMCTMELGWLDRRSGILVLSFTYSTHVWTVPVLALGMSMKKRNGWKILKEVMLILLKSYWCFGQIMSHWFDFDRPHRISDHPAFHRWTRSGVFASVLMFATFVGFLAYLYNGERAWQSELVYSTFVPGIHWWPHRAKQTWLKLLSKSVQILGYRL